MYSVRVRDFTRQELFLDLVPAECEFAPSQADLVSGLVFPGHMLGLVTALTAGFAGVLLAVATLPLLWAQGRCAIQVSAAKTRRKRRRFGLKSELGCHGRDGTVRSRRRFELHRHAMKRRTPHGLRSIIAKEGPGFAALGSEVAVRPQPERAPDVFLFNLVAEGTIARGRALTPAKQQALLAEDLANLPQFLGQPGDIVLVARRPSAGFLQTLAQAGFPLPEFVELRAGKIDPVGDLCRRELGSLRPWAWAPDSARLLEPLFPRVTGETRLTSEYFNDDIARLYSKAWSAGFLRRILARCHGEHGDSRPAAELQGAPGTAANGGWLCSEDEAGSAVDTLEEALAAIATIRRRGHHRVVVKQAYGWAGQNAIRLWEPELLPLQRQWLVRALHDSGEVVIEPWLEREVDFSVQLEMGCSGLQLSGYTGLINDRKGQFRANWAEADYRRQLPAAVVGCLGSSEDFAPRLHRLYDEIFSLLEAELRRVGFVGPVGIDAFIYRTSQGKCRLKPVVEINPRYTMGRLTVELMKHACPGSSGRLRLVTLSQARREGFPDLSRYADALTERLPLRREGEPHPGICQGAVCLNDPHRAQACLATFEVGPSLGLPGFAGRQ